MTVGNLVTLKIESDGLHIILEPDGREYLESQVEVRDPEGYPEIVFKQAHESILWELLEPDICNSDMDLLSANRGDYNELGALTGAPIIAYGVERDDDGKLINVGRTFWYPQYAIKSELEELLNDGVCIFEEAE